MGRDIVDPADSAEGLRLLELVGGRDHRLFAGKADKDEFGFVERTVVRMVKSPYGDYRDWKASSPGVGDVDRGNEGSRSRPSARPDGSVR